MKGTYKVGDKVMAIKDYGESLHKGCIYKVIHQYNDGYVKLESLNGHTFDAREIYIEYFHESQEVAMKRLEFTDTKWISATYS